MSAGRLIDALGHCRQAVIEASTKVKVMGPVYQGCHMVRAAIDALATLITGSKQYFHSQPMPGDKTWYKDRRARRVRDGAPAMPARLLGGRCVSARSRGCRVSAIR
jgi:hypothetical protein